MMQFGPALLFCPGDRPDRFGKAQAAADAVIIDLEDAVPSARKAAARDAVVREPLDPSTTIVRVNGAASGELAADLDALAATEYRTLMLPKAETLRDLEALAAYAVIALCESPLGVENASLLAAAPMVTGLMWGAEDLVAALGGSTSRHPDGRYRDVARYARSRVLLAAAAAGTAAFDTVHLDIADTAGLRDEAEDAAATGFAGTVCIHPSQVPVVRAAYAPLPEDVARARRVVEAAADAGGGVFTLDGRMVDEPLLRQARRVLEMAARTAS